MAKSPMLIVDVYYENEEIISSNRPSFLRKAENERVEKQVQGAVKSESKSDKEEEKTTDTKTETSQPKADIKEGEAGKEEIPANPEVK